MGVIMKYVCVYMEGVKIALNNVQFKVIKNNLNIWAGVFLGL